MLFLELLCSILSDSLQNFMYMEERDKIPTKVWKPILIVETLWRNGD